jgi:aerobic carbon-monoxide dehydrogenase large subunit
MTAADTADLGDLPIIGAPPGVEMTAPPYPVLARDTVKHVGDAVAYVVADTVEHARDGAEAIGIEWYALAPAIDAEAAVKPGAPRVWDDHQGNLAFETSLGDKAQTQAAFDKAAHVVTLRLTNPRVVANYLDTRGAIAEYDESEHRLILTAPTQGVHLVRDVLANERGVYTHTLPVDAYRGAGRPEASFVIERLVDTAAREIGIAPDELRRINFIRPEAMPYKTATGRTYDSGEFAGHLDRAQEVSDWKGFEKRYKAAEKRGRVRGLGMSSYIEACGGVSGETAKIRIEKDGSATLFIGTQSNGQGHATAYAQFAADELDLPLEKIVMRQGDTNDLPTGGGTGGSRSIPTGAPSVGMAAKKLAGQLKELAADELEAPPDRLEIVDGAVRVIGSNRLVTFAALASKPDADPEKLVAADKYDPPAPTFPNGTHICEVELDPESGAISIVGYWVVDDFGFTVNPLLLEGQIHGGIAQGAGQALGRAGGL